MSEVRKFRTQPIKGSDESFSFLVYGDMGITDVPGAHDTAKYMIEEAAKGRSFVFHIGDISYAVGFVSRTLQLGETSREYKAATFSSNASQPEVEFLHSSAWFWVILVKIVSLRVKTLSNTNLVASRELKEKKAQFRLTRVAQKRPA